MGYYCELVIGKALLLGGAAVRTQEPSAPSPTTDLAKRDAECQEASPSTTLPSGRALPPTPPPPKKRRTQSPGPQGPEVKTASLHLTSVLETPQPGPKVVFKPPPPLPNSTAMPKEPPLPSLGFPRFLSFRQDKRTWMTQASLPLTRAGINPQSRTSHRSARLCPEVV